MKIEIVASNSGLRTKTRWTFELKFDEKWTGNSSRLNLRCGARGVEKPRHMWHQHTGSRWTRLARRLRRWRTLSDDQPSPRGQGPSLRTQFPSMLALVPLPPSHPPFKADPLLSRPAQQPNPSHSRSVYFSLTCRRMPLYPPFSNPQTCRPLSTPSFTTSLRSR